jgi:microcystin-dependent protein
VASQLPLLGNPGNWEELEQSYAALQTWLGGLSSSVAALAGNLALTPIGGVLDFGGSTAPTGWLLCNGAAVSRATYAALFLIIGTTYGVGDGSTTFNVPDNRGRFGLGKAASGTGVTLGSTGGAIDHTHTGGTVSGSTGSTAPGTDTQGAHTHGGATGSHTHTFTSTGPSNFTADIIATTGAGVALPANSHTHSGPTDGSTASISSDGGHSHTVTSHLHAVGTLAVGASGTNNPPYIVYNRIIFAGV